MDPKEDARYARALDRIQSNDVNGLRSQIAEQPDLVDRVVADNTLLELLTQPCMRNVSTTIADVLIEGGSRLDRALNLAGCWNLADLCRRLLKAGADPTARADANITPLESAAMHGSSEAADVLVQAGVYRNSLWLAAASGQLSMVRGWVDGQGQLLNPPGDYRPNFADVGRPPGAAPTDTPAEILGEALVFAAANGRLEVVEYLLAAGVDIDSRPYLNTTGLHLAIQFRKPRIVKYLLATGASTETRDGQYNGDVRSWAAACGDGSPESAEIVALLNESR
jgi:ankyrin repeat protein